MSDNFIFDEKSGISVEEQKEILTQINGIAEKNRQRLSGTQNAGIKAKKKGTVFPLAVNIFAALILASGAFLLISFNSRADTQARTGGAVYNLTEKALIEEIRKDTEEKIAAKELEIAEIAMRLNEVDDELTQLYSSNQELSLEQRETQERLLSAQNAFRGELSKLNDERAEILEDSRSREARLRTQLDERTREFAAAAQRSSGELDSAARELDRLNTEKEKLEAINALLAGSLAASQSQDNRGELLDLQTRNTQLQSAVDELQKTIDSFNTGSSGQERRIAELDQAITGLRAEKTLLEQSAAEKDRSISALKTENSTLSSQFADLRAANAAQEQRITDLNNQLTAIRSLLQDN